jgi:lipopolysaccharide assembly outer membrane protein LptD (OstA)
MEHNPAEDIQAIVTSDSMEHNPAEDIQAIVTSDSMEYDPAENSYIFIGNVLIKSDNITVKAGKILYHADQSQVEAYGNIDYTDKDISIQAQQADLNLKTKHGSIIKGEIVVKKGEYYLSGEHITHDADNVYSVENAAFTTCDRDSPDWCFYAKKADIILDDSLSLKDVSFKIGGITTLYLPSYTLSLQKRKSGFLFPKIGYKSDKGFYGNLPFFLVLSSNRDVTLTLDGYSKRGVGQMFEYRYVERGGIDGIWQFYHLYDNKLKSDFYTVTGEHKHFNDTGFSSILNVDYVNDSVYFHEYTDRFDNLTKRFSMSNGELSYLTGKTRTYLSGEYWIDLKQLKEDVYQRVPELGLIVNPVNIGPVLFSFSGVGTNFLSLSSIDIDRLVIAPKISQTFGDSARVTQDIGVLTALYSGMMKKKDMDSLFISPWYRGRVNLSLMKNYGSFTHVIEPQFEYKYAMTDNNAMILDNFEFFDSSSILEFSIMNQLIDDKGLLIFLILASPYDFNKIIYHPSSEYKPFRPFKLSLFINKPLSLKADMSIDYYSGELDKVNSETGLDLLNIFDIKVGQRYNKKDDILFLSSGVGFNIFKSLRLDIRNWYDIKNDDLRYIEVDTQFYKKCWGINMLVRKAPDEYAVYLTFELKGIGGQGIKVI